MVKKGTIRDAFHTEKGIGRHDAAASSAVIADGDRHHSALAQPFSKTGKALVTLSWLLLALLSLQPVADGLLKPIEKSYPTWRGGQSVEYVVVLGGGYTWNPQWAPSSNLINNSLPRLAEGIRLWRENPGAKMIFTGAAAKTNPVSTAEAGARVAESLGVPRSAIIVLDRPKDTEQEAAEVKKPSAARHSSW